MNSTATDWTSNHRMAAARRGHESQRRHRTRLAALPVRLPVHTMRDARSEATLNYCLSRLREGERWDVLRHEVGCGPSHKDKKWREIKRRAVKALRRQEMADYLAGQFLKEQVALFRLNRELDQLGRRINRTSNSAKLLRLSRLWLSNFQKLCTLNNAFLKRRGRLAELMKRDQARAGASVLVGTGGRSIRAVQVP